MAFLAVPEVTAAANAVGVASAAKGAAKPPKRTRPAPKRPAPEPVDEGQGDEGGGDDEGQGDEGRGQSTWSRAGNASERVASVQAPRPIETGAGFLLGLMLWGVTLNMLQGGPKQAMGWILAKLINKPYGGTVNGNRVSPAKPGGVSA